MRKIQIVITCFIIFGHIAVFVHKKDFFPFSAYPMYSRIYQPEFLVFYKVFADLDNNQKIELKIQNYFPYFWKALFIEALLVDTNKSIVEKKLKSFAQMHNSLPKQKIKKIYILKYSKNWLDFSKEIQSGMFHNQHIQTPAQVIYEHVSR